MARHHNNRGEQRSVSKGDRPARPGEGRGDYVKVTAGNADYGTPVTADLARLRGRSRSELEADATRGASSPLGKGRSETERRKRK